ncbi:MAG: hypothetical protein Q8O67_15395 [Deltaproteobacteria bacterium]|nr:hypothetical protein [Deltaproteobacteria bacterium]
MSTVDPQRLKSAKELVTAVLTGKQTVEKNPALEQDDLLAINVGIVELNDAAWLESQLKDNKLNKDARMTIALQVKGPMRKPVLTALGAPAFVIGR